MKIYTIQTPIITSSSVSLMELMDTSIQELAEGSIVAITSKIVALCEGAAVPIDAIKKQDLVAQESNFYIPADESSYGFSFTITNDTLIPSAGIDESNANDVFVLWPRDAQRTCNEIRSYLRDRFGLTKVGVIITDSTCQPLRRGTTGICLAHSGFAALNDYVGEPDLFGRPMRVTQSNISGGIAAASVVCMGEGAESTPIAVMSDIDFVTFQDRDPDAVELAELRITPEGDLFAPFLSAMSWKRGGKSVDQ